MVVGICTYNRKETCQQLVNDLTEQGAKVVVLRDGGEEYLIKGAENYAKKNGGKEGYIATFRYLTQCVLEHAKDEDLCVFMPDDVEIHRYTVDEIEEQFYNTPEEVCCLNLLADNRTPRKQFKSHKPYIVQSYKTQYWNTGWVDGCFACTRDTLAKIKLKDIGNQFFKMNSSGSGLGHKLSEAFREQGKIWSVVYSLVNHLGHESVMNPEERQKHPLITNWKPPVSIIIPYVYDRGYLEQAIESAEAQEYEGDIEIIESQSNNRVGYNINRGLEEASGHYWRYLCDDDLIPKDATDRQVKEMNFGYDLVHANSLHFGPNATNVKKPTRKQFNARQLAGKNFINGGSCMYRTSKTIEINGWDEEVWTGEEVEFHLRMLANGGKLGYLDHVTYKYRKHGTQKSKKDFHKRKEYIEKIRAKYK